MKNTAEIEWLINSLVSSKILYHGTKWYLFGSVIAHHKICSDIDLVVLYHIEEHAANIRRLVKELNFERPVHLILFSYDEE